jgi:hypothetical protein
MAIDPKEIKSIEDSMVHDVEDDMEEGGHPKKFRVYVWWGLGILLAVILGLVFIGVLRSSLG